LTIPRHKVGESLKLVLNDFEGRASLYPRAILRDVGGIELAASPVDLTHVGDGLYVNKAVAMPNTEMVTAVYKTYTDAAHTLLSEDNQDRVDVFLRQDAEAVSSGVNIVERVEAVFKNNQKLAGEILEPKMRAILKPQSIEAALARQAISGVLKQQKITGLIAECT